MVTGLAPADGPVIELGPGTGKITESLLAMGFKESELTLFELNPEFHALLLKRFPAADIRLDNAALLGQASPKQVQAVVSGLPLLSFPKPLQHAILMAAFEKMSPNGVFVQYTYGPKCPLNADVMAELNLRAERGQKIWGNLPPARVYRIYQAQ